MVIPVKDARACRITKVTTFVVGMRWRNCVFALVETDEGISGIGEGSLEYQPKAVEAAIQQLSVRYAIGRSAFAIEKLWHDILRNEFMHSPDHQQRGGGARNGDARTLPAKPWDGRFTTCSAGEFATFCRLTRMPGMASARRRKRSARRPRPPPRRAIAA